MTQKLSDAIEEMITLSGQIMWYADRGELSAERKKELLKSFLSAKQAVDDLYEQLKK